LNIGGAPIPRNRPIRGREFVDFTDMPIISG
jgi:hypothetical protein